MLNAIIILLHVLLQPVSGVGV